MLVRRGQAARRRLRRRNVRTAGFLGIEYKFLDSGRASMALVSPTDATGAEADPATVNCLNAVAQGDGPSDRDGRVYTITSVQIRGRAVLASQINQTAADDIPYVYIALVLDMQTNGAQLNSEDVYTNPIASSGMAVCPFRNLQYSKRFRVLATRVMNLPMPSLSYDGTNMEQSGSSSYFSMNVNNLRIKVDTKGTSANVTDIVDNSLHLIAFCSSTAGSPTLSYNSRVRFVG